MCVLGSASNGVVMPYCDAAALEVGRLVGRDADELNTCLVEVARLLQVSDLDHAGLAADALGEEHHRLAPVQ
jgi:hypothetical protein